LARSNRLAHLTVRAEGEDTDLPVVELPIAVATNVADFGLGQERRSWSAP